MNGQVDGGEAITAAGLAALEAELADLEGRARQDIAERIRAARELGDLKENADYHIAKEDQAHLETRIRVLRERLRRAVVVDAGQGDGTFAFGRTAEVRDDRGELRRWTLVGSTEADPTEGRLSAESPVGRALRDAPVGAAIEIETPRGVRIYRIERVVA